MARKWTKWAAGVTGAATFATTLGLIQATKSSEMVGDEPLSIGQIRIDSVLEKDSIFATTIESIRNQDFISMPYFVSYDYEKEGMSQKQFEDYLLAKEKTLSSLDWGSNVIEQKQVTKNTNTKSERRTRVSK